MTKARRSLGSLPCLCVAFSLAMMGAALAEPLRIGNEGDYPPFAMTTADGKLEGFDIDIAKEICERLDRECELIVQEFKGLIPALQANRFDLIVSSMTINDERREQVLFSDPYYDAPYIFLARKGEGFEVSRDGLKGKSIGVVGAGAQRKWLEENYGDVVNIRNYDTPADIRADMISGRLDATLGTQPALYGAYIAGDAQNVQFEFVGEPIRDPEHFGEGAGIAARLGTETLINEVNEALNAMYADSTFKEINKKYFPFDIGAR